MAVDTQTIQFQSQGENDIIDITQKVCESISTSKINTGIVTLFVPGATGALSTIEYEPGLLQDIPQILEEIAPRDRHYHHHETWGCDNGRSHIKATLLGPSLTIPFIEKKLTLGTWQQIIFLELDTRARTRKVICQIIGE